MSHAHRNLLPNELAIEKVDAGRARDVAAHVQQAHARDALRQVGVAARARPSVARQTRTAADVITGR